MSSVYGSSVIFSIVVSSGNCESIYDSHIVIIVV